MDPYELGPRRIPLPPPRRVLDIRRTKSLPAAFRGKPRAKPPPFLLTQFLPALKINLPPPARHTRSEKFYCPIVPTPPSWLPGGGYGPNDGGLKLCDTRSLNDKYPFPLQDCTSWELMRLPDQALAGVITDWRRTPILSFRHDTRTTISRISPNMVAKWGPGVTQAEADMMLLIEGMPGIRNHVPKVHKVLRDEVTNYLIIIMEYVNGSNFADFWRHPSTTANQARAVVKKIVNVVQLMHKNTARYPGSAGIHRSRALVHKDHPVSLCMDGQAYTLYLNSLIGKVNRLRPARRRVDKVNFDKFVLTNMQLEPSSFIIDKKGAVWIVGWGKGGFFPIECELAIAERSIPLRFFPLTLALVTKVPHDRGKRESVRAVAAFIDGDPLEMDEEESETDLFP